MPTVIAKIFGQIRIKRPAIIVSIAEIFADFFGPREGDFFAMLSKGKGKHTL